MLLDWAGAGRALVGTRTQYSHDQGPAFLALQTSDDSYPFLAGISSSFLESRAFPPLPPSPVQPFDPSTLPTSYSPPGAYLSVNVRSMLLMPRKSHATPLNQPIAVPSVAAVGNLVGSSSKFPTTNPSRRRVRRLPG